MQAVIFDLDGTLCDSREAMYWQFEELTREFDGAPASRTEIAAAAHGTTEQIVRTLVHNTDAPFEEIMRRHTELRLESVAKCSLYPGAVDLLPLLHRIGVRVVAVTAGNRHNVAYLQQANIHQYFDAIVTSEDNVPAKPQPDGLLLALQKVGVAPEEAVMVGDMPTDIFAGKNAHVAKTVGVTHGFGTVEALLGAHPDHIVHDIPSLLDVLE